MFDIYRNLELKNDWLILTVAAFTTLANGLVPVVISILTGRVFNLLKFLGTDTYKTKSEFVHELTLRSFSIAAVAACVIPISWVSISCWMAIGERQGFRIRSSLLSFYFDRDLQWYDANQNIEGEFIQVNRCVEEVRASSAEASAIISQNIVSIIALIATSMYYSWSLTLIILCSLPLLVILVVWFSKKVEKFSKLENAESTNASSILAWSLSAFQMIRLFDTSYLEQANFETSIFKCRKFFVKSCLFAALNASSLRFLVLCMFVQGFWFGNTQIKRGNLDAGDVVTCFSSCLLLGSSLSGTLQQIVTIQKGKVAMQRINGFILPKDTLTDMWEKRNSIISSTSSIGLSPIFCEGDIVFDNISFAYPTRPDDYILKNVSIHIRSGVTSFIVGKSGSGKSTLASLLLKMYSNYTGDIKFGRYNLQSLDDSWLTENITLVEQSCTLFNGTLKNNITIANKDASDDDVRKACQFALLNSALHNLSDGVNTLLGRHGVTLSGGQQQRVALARAYLRDTPVLILDESLSALDAMSRELIVEAIRHWRNGKSTIVLTHEYSQIKENDYVYLMDEGAVVESGFKHELLAKSDSYFTQLNYLQNFITEPPTSPDAQLPYSPGCNSAYACNPISRFSRFFFDTVGLDTYHNNPTVYNSKKRIRPNAERIDPANIKRELQNSQKGDLEENRKPGLMKLSCILKKMTYSMPKRRYLLLGLLFSAIAGISNPLFSYTFSKLLTGIAQDGSNNNSSFYLMKWSIIVLSLAAVDGVSTFFKDFLLGYCSELWITQLRIDAMSKISRCSLEWFGLPNNNSSELNSLIMNDLRDLRGLASEFLSAITTLIFVAFVGLIWAIAAGWKLSLVCISLFPAFLLFSGVYGSLLQVYETTYKNEIAELETKAHEIVTFGIVGESGSGKSTLSLLLTRLYSVPDGRISIGKTDINRWDEEALRRQISIVEQKPKFFDGTVRENLVYGMKKTVSVSELSSVLRSVALSSFVRSLPYGLDTRIHLGLMSGGQAQRLSIARALLRDPKIMILDECTSALDATNSFAIAELIKSVLIDVTVIVITHSEQMMQVCDRLLVINKGKVKEEGSFSELLERRGELYRIVSSSKG
ncbi:unnamed protein product [Kluyveromyces dobzhanskii CBS 2104]|uniref:WGS project CCBQ000000000 data, contig 00015 n=1 Tax=Kluyveromyces dobzhanskii CBS 2104 TaxID=1427455 RepID=A0A0A8LCX5_9SACH|nr:unnamed protein product [Kluyveromyces dobzhanskii CBS 2104]